MDGHGAFNFGVHVAVTLNVEAGRPRCCVAELAQLRWLLALFRLYSGDSIYLMTNSSWESQQVICHEDNGGCNSEQDQSAPSGLVYEHLVPGRSNSHGKMRATEWWEGNILYSAKIAAGLVADRLTAEVYTFFLGVLCHYNLLGGTLRCKLPQFTRSLIIIDFDAATPRN